MDPRTVPPPPQADKGAPAGQQQHNRGTQPANRTAGDNELANRLDSVIAMLPPETGRNLRRRYHDPKELLRPRHRRAQPAKRRRGQNHARGADARERLAARRGRQLKLTTDEQTDLRRQYHGRPEALLKHITAVWTAQRKKAPRE